VLFLQSMRCGSGQRGLPMRSHSIEARYGSTSDSLPLDDAPNRRGDLRRDNGL